MSDLALQGLVPCSNLSSCDHDVRIRRDHIDPSLPQGAVTFSHGQYNKNELLLDIAGIARFLLRNGNEIIIQQTANSHNHDVCTYLLGTVFGVLCHQRGIMPLHASAIDTADGCIAFVGASGAGKSTLVAALAARGHQVTADDVLFLQIGATGNVQAWPGVNRICLREDAMNAVGCEGPGIEREVHGDKKYLIPVRPAKNVTEARRLLRVYQLLAALEEDGAPSVNRLRGASALEVLLQNVYRLDVAENMGHKTTAFPICAAMARNVPVFQLRRSISFADLHKGIAFLEDHMHDVC